MTLEFISYHRVDLRTEVAVEGGLRVARACVRQDGFDGGYIEWYNAEEAIRIYLAHEAVSLVAWDGNLSANTGGNASFNSDVLAN